MKFYIQDPIFSQTYSIHEALLAGCTGVKYGAGVFAFVTNGGVNLFLCDQVFEKSMLNENSKFKLIVGIDDITNTKTLKKLEEVLFKYGQSLEVLVFMHEHKNTTFHPKFTWFRKETGGVLIVGSNNLTEKGLRRNIEAFNYNEVDDSQIDEIEKYFNAWIESNKKNLFSIDDEKVIEKAKENERLVFVRKKNKKTEEVDGEDSDENEDLEADKANTPEQTEESTIDDEDFEAWDFSEDNDALIVQISKNGRVSQIELGKTPFERFFGAQVGQNHSHRVLLRNVNSISKLGAIEVRQSFSVVSKNYRFEVDAGKKLVYPKNKKPIAIFINVAIRMYLYVLAMPNDSFYNELEEYISQLKSTNTVRLRRPNDMVRHITKVSDIKSKCPNLPLWNITQ